MRSDLVLTSAERQRAASAVLDLAQRFPLNRVEAIFRSLARGESLRCIPSLQNALPLHSTSLLRNERLWATSTALALRLDLGEESAERVIAWLGRPGAPIGALMTSENAWRGVHAALVPEAVN